MIGKRKDKTVLEDNVITYLKISNSIKQVNLNNEFGKKRICRL